EARDSELVRDRVVLRLRDRARERDDESERAALARGAEPRPERAEVFERPGLVHDHRRGRATAADRGHDLVVRVDALERRLQARAERRLELPVGADEQDVAHDSLPIPDPRPSLKTRAALEGRNLTTSRRLR